jgi:uncharacterized RDD family membrane protein YckC
VVADLYGHVSDRCGLVGYVLTVVALWMVSETILLAALGTTPGKWICGLRVQKVDGSWPDVADTARRSFGVWWRGIGFGIPIILLGEAYAAYRELRRAGSVAWDRNAGTQVIQKKRMGALRRAVVAALIIFSVLRMIGAQSRRQAAAEHGVAADDHLPRSARAAVRR